MLSHHRSPPWRLEAYIAQDADVDRRLQKMNQRIEALCHQALAQDDELGFNIDPSFNKKIMQEIFIPHFKIS